MRVAFLSLILCIVAFGQPDSHLTTRAATSSQPAVTSRPVVTRPARDDDDFSDRPLSPEEKKEYQAALASNRQNKLSGADDLRQKLNRSLAEARERRKAKVESEIKSMEQNEGARDKAGAARSQTYQYRYKSSYVGGIKSNKTGIDQANDRYEAQQNALAEAKNSLDAIEACHRACLDTVVHLQYEQLRRAAGTQRRARIEFKKLTDPFYGEYAYHLNQLASRVKAEYQKVPDIAPLADVPGKPVPEMESVAIGMTSQQVREVWGPPDRASSSKWTYGNTTGNIRTVTFDARGKVTAVEFK